VGFCSHGSPSHAAAPPSITSITAISTLAQPTDLAPKINASNLHTRTHTHLFKPVLCELKRRIQEPPCVVDQQVQGALHGQHLICKGAHAAERLQVAEPGVCCVGGQPREQIDSQVVGKATGEAKNTPPQQTHAHTRSSSSSSSSSSTHIGLMLPAAWGFSFWMAATAPFILFISRDAMITCC